MCLVAINRFGAALLAWLGLTLGALFGVATWGSGPVLAAPDAKLFGQLPQAFDAAISPDGTQSALIQAHNGQYLINVIALDGQGDGELRLIGLEEGVKPEWIRWVNNERVIVSFWQSESYRGTPFTTGYLYSLDTTSMKGRILVKPDGWRQYNNEVLDWLEDEPDYIIMQFADDDGDQSYPDVRKVNVATGRDKIIRRRHYDVTRWITDTRGEPVAGFGYKNDTGRDFFLLIKDPMTGDWDSSEDYPGLDANMTILSALAGGRQLVVRAYRGKDTLGLHLYDLTQKRFVETIFQSDEFDAGSVLFSKDGERVVGATHLADRPERELLPEYGSVLKEAESVFDGFDVEFIDQTDDGDTLLLKVSSPYDPGGLFLYRKGQQYKLLSASYPGLEVKDMGEVVSIRYKARDGERIPAYVTLPAQIRDTADIKNLPFVILPHGGPISRDYQRFDWLAQLFASRGYGVLQMNFRGSSGYGKSFKDAGRENWALMQDDVEDGTRYLIAKGYADPDRICVAGWSYGGYAALMGAANDPSLYQCAIAIAALSDVEQAYKDARRYTFGKGMAERTFGNLLDDKDLMKANNPVKRAEDIRVPVLMAHGTLDSAVDYDQYKSMKRALEKAGVKGTYLSFEDEDHYMSAQQNRQDLAEALERFLETHLGEGRFAAN